MKQFIYDEPELREVLGLAFRYGLWEIPDLTPDQQDYANKYVPPAPGQLGDSERHLGEAFGKILNGQEPIWYPHSHTIYEIPGQKPAGIARFGWYAFGVVSGIVFMLADMLAETWLT